MSKFKKTFTYRFYNSAGVQLFHYQKFGIKIDDFPSWGMTINGGTGQVNLRIKTDITNYIGATFTASFATCRIYVSDRESSASGDLLWVGLVDTISTTIGKHVVIDVSINGLSFLFAFHVARITTTTISNGASGDRRFTYTDDDPADILRDLITQYNQLSTTIFYTPSSIDDTGLTLTCTINAMTFFEAVQEVMKFLPELWYFRINGNGLFEFHKTDLNNVDHVLHFGKEIAENSSVKVSLGGIVNTVEIHGGDTGGGTNLYKRYTNTVSIANYGRRELIVSNQNITTTTGANLLANSILEKRLNPVRSISISVIDSNYNDKGYDIETLKVGDSIQIKSSDIQTFNSRWDQSVWDLHAWDYGLISSIGVPFQIQQIQYNGDRATLVASDMGTSQNDTIETLRRKEIVNATLKSPDQPT